MVKLGKGTADGTNLSKYVRSASWVIRQFMKDSEEIEQTCGKALGYPWYKDDQKNFPGTTEADGVCIGEHVSVSIVSELAAAYIELRDKHIQSPIRREIP